MGNVICNFNKYIHTCEERITKIDQTLERIRKFEEIYKMRLEDINEFGTCQICCLNPRNVTIVHGDTAHTCCCKECVSGLKECPVCRSEIDRIVTNFIS